MQADQRIVVKDNTVGQIAAMKRKLATLEEENQIFRRSGCGTSSTIDEKILAVEQLHGDFTVHAICRTLNLAKGTFHNRLYRTPAETIFEHRKVCFYLKNSILYKRLQTIVPHIEAKRRCFIAE